MTPDPLFIVGTERSGSNLLRVILSCHPKLAVPHPPHILRYFRKIEQSYGDLNDDVPFRRLARDIAWLIRYHIYPWDIAVDPARAQREAPRRDSFGLYVAFMEQYREAHHKARWACKSTFMVDELAAISEVFPEPRVVMLVRDPRDVAVSSRQSVFSTFHPYFTAKLWTAQQEEGLRWLPTLAPRRMWVLHYERLLAAPEPSLRALCDFIGEDFAPEMLRYFESKEAKRSAALSASWANTAAPIQNDRIGRYHKHLSPEEIRLVEAVAGPTMAKLGYQTETPLAELAELQLSDTEIARFKQLDRQLRQAVDERSRREDHNYLRRKRRDAYVALLSRRHGR